jgi:hypothetical protein
LIGGVEELLDVLSDWVSEVRVLNWKGSEDFYPIVRRASLSRQFETLEIIKLLCAEGKGFAAVPMLRASCEELLWLRYLESLPFQSANRIVASYISTGILKDLRAQVDEVGIDVLTEIGLTPHLESFRQREPTVIESIKNLAIELDWPQNCQKKGQLPSTWYVAQQSNSQDMYKFLFHASSRYVHFSPVELARRGWGSKGTLKITNEVYEPNWAVFSLQWGARIFGHSIQVILDSFRQEGVVEPPHKELVPIFQKIGEVPMVPLITADELKWSHPDGDA